MDDPTMHAMSNAKIYARSSCLPAEVDGGELVTHSDIKVLSEKEIRDSARRWAEWKFSRDGDPTAAPTDFVPRGPGIEKAPGSIPLALRNTGERLNEALGAINSPLGLYLWLTSLEAAMMGDADLLTWAAALTGINGVGGSLMGVIDGAVHGNWVEFGLSGAGLIALFAAQVVPVVGELLDIALGIYMVVSQLVDLVREAMKSPPGDDDAQKEFREERTKAWKIAMVKQCDETIIPIMEKCWRIYEQNLLLDFEIVLATADLQAEKIKAFVGAKDPEYTIIDQKTAESKEQMWERFRWLLADAATIFQMQMQSTLRKMLLDQGNFTEFSRQIGLVYSNERYNARYDKCHVWGAKWSGGNCLPLQDFCCEEAAKEDQLRAREQIELTHTDAPLEVWQEIWDLFDKDGRFFPRALPPITLPAPHVVSVESNEDPQENVKLTWAPPKALPYALVRKITIEIRGGGISYSGRATDREAHFKDWGGDGLFGGKWQEVSVYFQTPDITGFPQFDTPTLKIDRRLRSKSSCYIEWEDNRILRDSDLTKVPRNYGYRAIEGLYMIVNEQSGMAMDVKFPDLLSNAQPFVMQTVPLGSRSQAWKIQFDGPSADEPDRWGYSSIVNEENGLSLDVNTSTKRLTVSQAKPGASTQTWFIKLPHEAGGFVIRNHWSADLGLNAGNDGVPMWLGNDLSGSPLGRWRFLPIGTTTPTLDRFYTITNDATGMSLDFTDPEHPGLSVPHGQSPLQVFHLGRANGATTGAVVLHNLFRDRYLQLAADGVKTTENVSSAACSIQPAWGGAWKIAAADGKVLDAKTWTKAPGALVLAAEDAGSPSQLWRIAKAVTAVPNGWGIVTAAASGLALGIQNSGVADGQPAWLEPYSATRLRRWIFASNSDETHTITSLSTGGVLAPRSASVDESAPIVQIQNPQPASGRWSLCPTPEGNWVIRNGLSGKVLEAEAPLDNTGHEGRGDTRKVAANGSKIVQRQFSYCQYDGDYRVNVNQIWSISPVSAPQIMVELTPTESTLKLA